MIYEVKKMLLEFDPIWIYTYSLLILHSKFLLNKYPELQPHKHNLYLFFSPLCPNRIKDIWLNVSLFELFTAGLLHLFFFKCTGGEIGADVLKVRKMLYLSATVLNPDFYLICVVF